MNFAIGKFVQSLLKKSVSALVAFLLGPALAPWLHQLGITIDAAVLSTGLFGLLEGGRIWLTHQPWSPPWMKYVL